MKKQIIRTSAAVLALSLSAFAVSTDNFDLRGNIQTQGITSHDNGDDVMDSFWFRANFGGMYKSDDFDGQISIRMPYPLRSPYRGAAWQSQKPAWKSAQLLVPSNSRDPRPAQRHHAVRIHIYRRSRYRQ